MNVDSEPEDAILFSESYLHWITRAGASNGWFQLDAVLEVIPAGTTAQFQYVLAAGVPAGRMYATSGPLLRQPPYSFQMITGLNEHTILRRELFTSNPSQVTDTSDFHSKQFHSVDWHITTMPAIRLKPNSVPKLAGQSAKNILLEYHVHGSVLRLEAPLRHWNYRADPEAWQIETGPLLWPLRIKDLLYSPQSSGLTTAWLHANKDNRITISGDRLAAQEIEAQLYLLETI